MSTVCLKCEKTNNPTKKCRDDSCNNYICYDCSISGEFCSMGCRLYLGYDKQGNVIYRDYPDLIEVSGTYYSSYGINSMTSIKLYREREQCYNCDKYTDNPAKCARNECKIIVCSKCSYGESYCSADCYIEVSSF